MEEQRRGAEIGEELAEEGGLVILVGELRIDDLVELHVDDGGHQGRQCGHAAQQLQQLVSLDGVQHAPAATVFTPGLTGHHSCAQRIQHQNTDGRHGGADEQQILRAHNRRDPAREAAADNGAENTCSADETEESPALAGVEHGVGQQPQERRAHEPVQIDEDVERVERPRLAVGQHEPESHQGSHQGCERAQDQPVEPQGARQPREHESRNAPHQRHQDEDVGQLGDAELIEK